MRVRLSLIGLLSLLIAAIAVTGCGASKTPAAKPAVSLSILAPTSGATIGVRDLVVAGTVSPATANVTIGGEAVKVVNGSYNVPLHMTSPSETITVSGQASGYTPGSATTTVQYSAAMASAISAAESTLSSDPQPNTSPAHKSSSAPGQAAKAAAKPPTHAPAVVATAAKQSSSGAKPAASHSTGHASTTHHTSSTHHTSTHRASTHHTSAHHTSAHHTSTHKAGTHSGSSKHSSSARHSGDKSAHTSKPSSGTSGSGRQPEQRTVWTVKNIKQLWINGCVKAGAGASYKPYCRCTYAHLSKAGELKSHRRLKELMRKLRPYERTHDVAKLPAAVRRAIFDCASKLPPLEPMVAKPSVNKLPGTSYPSTPVNTPTSPSGTSTTPPTTTTPTPAPTGTAPTGTTPTNPTTTQSSGANTPPWASLVRELNRVVAAVAAHHPLTAASTDHRSVRKAHRRAA